MVDCKSAGLRLRRFESYLPHQSSRLALQLDSSLRNAKKWWRSRPIGAPVRANGTVNGPSNISVRIDV
jgi:hypothetical protein